MKRTPPPYAAIAVVTVTATVFVYFSCSSKEPDGKSATDSLESFGKDLPEGEAAIDPAEADLKAILATNCASVTEGSEFCKDLQDQSRIGQ